MVFQTTALTTTASVPLIFKIVESLSLIDRFPLLCFVTVKPQLLFDMTVHTNSVTLTLGDISPVVVSKPTFNVIPH